MGTDRRKGENLPPLSKEAKQRLVDRWNDKTKDPPNIKECIQIAFGKGYTGQHTKYKEAVIKYLAEELKVKPKASYQYEPKEKTELSDDQKEYIENHLGSMRPLEMAKELFGSHITNLHKEFDAVKYHYTNCNSKLKYVDQEEIEKGKYKPPKSLNGVISRVNKYLYKGIDKENLSPQQEKHLKALIGHLHTSKFIYHVNSFEDATERELFESSFIRYLYDSAADVDESEADQFCNLAIESIWQKRLEKQIRDFDKLLEKTTDEDEKLSMSIAESAKGLRADYNTCLNRQQKILADLKTKRSERLKTKKTENESFIHLIDFWRNEQKRKLMIDYAEERKKGLKKETERLKEMSDLKAEIYGLDPEEILNS